VNDLIPFDYSGRQVRTVTIDSEPWFVAADVCAVLEIGNPSQAVSYLDDDERASTLISSEGGQCRPVNIINEPGLYSLILRSRKPEAKAFKRWVTHEVLPSIRRTGGYRLPATFSEALRELADKHDQLEAAKPKVEAFDTYMDADNAIAMGVAANQLGIGRNTMMRRLREAGVLQKDNRPYQRYAQHFKVVAQSYEAQNETRATYTTYVRPSGVELIRKVISGGKGLVAIPGGVA
jgi:prophage antirepressor-like protein